MQADENWKKGTAVTSNLHVFRVYCLVLLVVQRETHQKDVQRNKQNAITARPSSVAAVNTR